jgi:hypothetical protein
MQDPIEDSSTQSPHPDEARAEDLAGIHQESTADGNDPVAGASQATLTPMADTSLLDASSSKTESALAFDSAVPITPMLDLMRSDPWRILMVQLKPGEHSMERTKMSPTNVKLERTYQTENEDLADEIEKLPASLCMSLTLPSAIRGYGSTRKLFDSIVALLRTHVPLSEKDCLLVAYWSIATWFLDFLPFLPSLVLTGPALAADRLLRTLVAICRRPWMLADMSSAVLLKLPLSGLRPTLLIRKPQLNDRFAALLDASNQRGYLAYGGKNFHELYSAKCIYIGEQASLPVIVPNSIHVHVSGESQRNLSELPTDDNIQTFQQQLLFYRFLWHDVVRDSKPQDSQPHFRPELGATVQALGAAFVSEPDLKHGIMELLRERDEQSRVDVASSLNGVVLRALLLYCHQTDKQEVFVREIADAASGFWREEGESLRIRSERAGFVLKYLGLYSRRLGSKGRGLILDKSTQSQVHQLAYAYDVLPSEPCCGYCQNLQAPHS